MLDGSKIESCEIEKTEKISKSTDSRYKTLFQQVNAAAFLTNFDGKILEANVKSCELLGYSWDELQELSLRDIFPESTDWSQLIDELSAKGGMNFEAENVKRDGKRIPVDISISLFRMEDKPVMLALIRDISDRKKAERKLQESEQEYRGLFESTTDGTIVLDARGEILDANTSALEMFGLQKEQVVGNNFLQMDLLTPESLPIVVKQFGDLLSNRKTATHETVMRDKTGNLLNVELSSFFLVRKGNQIDNFVVIIRDISDRKQAEIKLVREHGLLQTLMDNIPDSIYFKDEKNTFIMVNKAKAAHSNVNPEDMIGKTDFDFLSHDQAKKAFEDDQEILNSGKYIINKVEKLTDRSGADRWVSVTKVPRFDAEGNIIGTVGISRDITDWKKLEEMYNEEVVK